MVVRAYKLDDAGVDEQRGEEAVPLIGTVAVLFNLKCTNIATEASRTE
jgi:hypothetical protein